MNEVAFRGRVRGRLLESGVYTIVRQPAVRSSQRPKTVAVSIDARGIRPAAAVRWHDCNQVVATSPPSLSASNAHRVSALRASGIAPAEVIPPAKSQGVERLPIVGWMTTIGGSSELSALLLTLLAISAASLCIAAFEPGYMVRYRPVRVIAHHRRQIACFGGVTLFCAIVVYALP
jgi:hypothetical protein